MKSFVLLVLHLSFLILLGYYLILNLQWYNYKFKRILLHHHNPWLHIVFFLLPLFIYFAFPNWLWAIVPVYGLAIYLWLRKIDKRLVFTQRVKRFFGLLLFFTLFFDLLCLLKFDCRLYPTILPLAAAFILSAFLEKMFFHVYKKDAKKRLESIDPTIVAVTASYGKTSVKNFIYQLLKPDYKVYKTPRSVNTLAGIMKDINESLPADTEIYIVEAGAREQGDIAEIAHFLDHHYAVIGKIGPQHIEYFKSIEKITLTKLELLQSKRLKKAFIWDGIKIKDRDIFVKFGKNIENIKESLDGIEFDLKLGDKVYHFFAPVLGGFNALNITAAILVAKEFGIDMKTIQDRVSKLKPIEHRLQKIETPNKLVIDDSFNGNLEGMVASYELVKNYKGRKIVVTPGIVESDEESNVKLAQKINEVFDLAIITGKINKEVLDRHITIDKVLLQDKSKLQEILAQKTKPGDLILFSNDAPGYL